MIRAGAAQAAISNAQKVAAFQKALLTDGTQEVVELAARQAAKKVAATAGNRIIKGATQKVLLEAGEKVLIRAAGRP